MVAPILVAVAMESARKLWDHLNVNVMVCSQSAEVFSKQHCSVVALPYLADYFSTYFERVLTSFIIRIDCCRPLICEFLWKYFCQYALPLPYNMHISITRSLLLRILYLIRIRVHRLTNT